jgi:hypothetical protein
MDKATLFLAAARSSGLNATQTTTVMICLVMASKVASSSVLTGVPLRITDVSQSRMSAHSKRATRKERHYRLQMRITVCGEHAY